MASEYRLKKTELNGTWDEFIKSSENGTLFSLSGLLENINQRTAQYYCYNNEELRAAVCLTVNDSGELAISNGFVIHNGIIFSSPSYRQNRAQRIAERFDIMSFIAAELAAMYRTVELRLEPSIQDIRAFLWFNYDQPGPKYIPEVRYTSFVQIQDFAGAKTLEDIESYRNASSSRRQEIRYAVRDHVRTVEEFTPDAFVNFYLLTMQRQDIAVDDSSLLAMRRLINGLFQHRLGRMFVSYTAKGEPASMAFFGVDGKRAYYLFGVNDPALRTFHAGTAVLWDAFKALAADGVTEVDLEGVNSPKRGWFKLSFGGDIRPYFHLRLG